MTARIAESGPRKFRRTRRNRIFGALALAVSVGCASDPPSNPPAHGKSAPFFEASTSSVGDVVSGLRIRRLDVHPSLAEPPEWVGSVWFDGRVTLSGRYGPHHDHPEPDLLCFFPDAASALRLPRFAYDERISWFCFRNRDEAVAALSPPPATGVATVTVDDFAYHYAHSDVVNEARFVGVEPVQRRTPTRPNANR